MKHYVFADSFRALYTKALTAYADGIRQSSQLFSRDEVMWLESNGLTAQSLYDYAEDESNGGQPGYDIALGIELVRRDYFHNVQRGVPSTEVLDEAKLPAKTAAVRGIEWLPRIIPKARAKLRGQLPPSLMYCCGGDRRFFQTHDLHPHEFLNAVWRFEGNDDALVEWVVARARKQ